MLKPFFSRGETRDSGGEAREREEMWELPDMEVAPLSTQEPRKPKLVPAFEYEEQELPPAGSFTAELAGWTPLDARRIAWRFVEVAGGEARVEGPFVEFVTGTVLRPDNHLCRLVAALGLAPSACSGDHPRTPEALDDLRRAAAALQPDLLVGRRCRLEVEHFEDELGNISARVARIGPEEGR